MQTQAKKLEQPRRNAAVTIVASTDLRQGDVFLVETGDVIPADGEVIEGVASVNESAVTGGTWLLSDWLIVRVTASPGSGFLDRMVALVEGARRRKLPMR